MRKLLAALLLPALTLIGADYTGPRPPKPDIPYLLHASNLVETEVAEAQESGKKGESTFTIPGANSPARTPLAEPIFILDAHQLSPDRMELYRLDVRNGRRELTLSSGRRRGGNRPLHLQVTPLGGSLYRIEADEHLDPGEYSLSPNDSNHAFCFEVY